VSTPLSNIRVHGLGLTDDFLLQLSDRAQTALVKGAEPATYELPPRTPLEEAILDAWDDARKAWTKYQAHGQDLWAAWVRPLLKALDYTFSASGATGERYAVNHLSEGQDVPLHFAQPLPDGTVPDLDRVIDATGLRVSPHGLMQGYLNATPAHLWGIVTNGEVLRVLRDNAQVTRPAFVEFRLADMMNGEDSRAFRVMWLLLHRTRLRGAQDSVLERWNSSARETGVKARDSLRDGVQRAIEALGSGFLRRSPGLEEVLATGETTPTDLYRACLKLVYQLVFLFVTEDRDLLHPPGTDAGVRERARHYLTRTLRDRASAISGSSQHTDAYEGLKRLLVYVRTGFEPLGLPALGSHLFQPQHLGSLAVDDLRLTNEDLHSAIRALSVIQVDRSTRPVNYAGLDSEELGSIYESLLELVPRVEPGPSFRLAVLAGNERKTTGSYYTPTSLIELLLESALDPVIEDAVRGKSVEDAIAALKALKIIDPACGSGHFLIAAARRVGSRLASLEEGTSQPSPPALRRATRTVIAHCIYGSDINPMAIELAKVALWLESQDAGKPLAFLDHRLRVGNSLLGTTPELMRCEDEIPEKVTRGVKYPAVKAVTLHLPDDAFAAIEGDDKKTVSELKKRNKAERENAIRAARGQQTLGFDMAGDLAPLTRMVEALDKIEPESAEHVQAQAATWGIIQNHNEMRRLKTLADAWCAAFVLPRVPGAPAITTATLHTLDANAQALPEVRAAAAQVAEQYHFLHPHIEFPDVARKGGFDCVLGNPPWERLKLQEKEWFAQRVPEIAEAPNAAARTRMIAALKKDSPAVYADFLRDLRQAEGESHFIRSSGRYPLTGRGDVNTYAIFSELCRNSLNGRGRMGIIVPTGIVTDDTTKFFFQSLMEKKSLVKLLSFENERHIFPGVHNAFKFCLLVNSGENHSKSAAEFLFFARYLDDVQDPERIFSLSPEEIALLNPNTRTAPVFRTARDATITKAIYQRVPVLLNEALEQNPWGIRFMRMFDMSNDSSLFRTAVQLNDEGWRLDGNRYYKSGLQMSPLYEAKMMHQFDHRFGTYSGQTEAQANKGNLPGLTEQMHADTAFLTIPKYWVAEAEVENRLIQRDKDGNVIWKWDKDWLMGFRDITRNTDERTGIFSIEPRTAIGHTNPVFFTDENPENQAAMFSSLNSFVLDYAARQKVGGTHLTYGFLKQFPVLPPPTFTPERLSFITPRVLELTYTAHDLTGFARDLGYARPPFIWNDERRFWLRAELDALYFMLYGIGRDDVAYIMDTFPIVRRKDEAMHGTYRTKEAILEIYDDLTQLGLERLHEYRGRVELLAEDVTA